MEVEVEAEEEAAAVVVVAEILHQTRWVWSPHHQTWVLEVVEEGVESQTMATQYHQQLHHYLVTPQA